MARQKRKHYTKAEVTLIRQMIVNGDSNKKIARETGRQVRALPYFKSKYASDLPKVKSRRHVKRTRVRTASTKSTDATSLVELIVGANVPKEQKLRCLEALL